MQAYNNALRYIYSDLEFCNSLLQLAHLDANLFFDIIYHTLQIVG